MRRPHRLRAALLAALLVAGAACSDDDDTATTTTPTTATTVADPALDAVLVRQEELPAGFEPSPDVDDTITAFCAGEDAAAGLQATGRALAGYRRQPEGASVIHLVFRFRTGDAERFVDQAAAILDRCSEVPDTTGLAFTYTPAAPAVDAALAGTDAHVARHGVSIGSGNLAIDIGVFRYGEVGELVAVLAVDATRDALDGLSAQAFAAASARRP
ncbi:MAG TPA: hypothetical protein VJ804_07770 [Acidimicrobiales bacterium]|nr:hypothetical protein [Acidimicrobiales bacterium]